MKNLLLLFVLLSSTTFYAQKKVYFTEDFKELPSANKAIYYSIYEENTEGTTRTTYYLDNTLYSKDQFSNYKKRILHGTSERWYKNGAKEMLTNYSKGKQEGVQTRYFENGQIKRTENFKKGEFIDGKCFDENGTEIEFFPYFIKPEFPGGMKAFYDFISSNFKAPNNGIGEVIIGFSVELDGALNHFEVIKSVNKQIDLTVIKTLVKCPKWIPGKIDGKAVVIKYKIPINIQDLNNNQVIR
ncbi:energy transducer TonB [Flavobacterium glaciei]|uniref:TonB-like protein n=1 Tax=Flavobacterium glaciei TaxID=386300 RepID=A0A562Q294_9FLAO|nr:energy transducer TonB [Flavobacterium glaciei]RDI57415.1 TonB-like protein [Flavobacterium glaciei]TWI50783.1 TonB-like protein [Flavobacterium glaciei]